MILFKINAFSSLSNKIINITFFLCVCRSIYTHIRLLHPSSFATIENGFIDVWFYGISTILGYLMPNLVYSYVLDIYDL